MVAVVPLGEGVGQGRVVRPLHVAHAVRHVHRAEVALETRTCRNRRGGDQRKVSAAILHNIHSRLDLDSIQYTV